MTVSIITKIAISSLVVVNAIVNGNLRGVPLPHGCLGDVHVNREADLRYCPVPEVRNIKPHKFVIPSVVEGPAVSIVWQLYPPVEICHELRKQDARLGRNRRFRKDYESRGADVGDHDRYRSHSYHAQ